ncbi:PITH domain-containing protein [Lipomyces kononenkoae]|uniref:PITH domain-containing protein n=1 Tax=Lipomyces kononenkoae TaxID=34357 RepID=A0ACC3T2Z0_LIPKO
MATNTVKVITSQAQIVALATHDLAVIDFNAVWCGPCKTIAPHFEKFPAKYPNVAFASVDIDQNKDIASQYEITAVPTFLFLNKGEEVARVRGANLQQLEKTLRAYASLTASGAGNDSAAAESSSSASSSQLATGTYRNMIPKGLDVLNDVIELKNLEALNATATKSSDITSSVRDLFSATDLSAGVSTPIIESDADSQLLFYVPFMNASKVHSILIQSPVAKENDNGDDEGKQRATKIKVWTNSPAILSFDDTSSVPTAHEGEVSEPDEQGWSAVRLRYVRFQRVSSLVVFLDGDDEDEPTGVNKIVFIGERGEKLEMGKLGKHDE